jgi:endonuclease YncB( thermonuclease family)
LAAALASVTVIDGDTVHIASERYRLLGIDAAEIGHAKCEAERRLGLLTKRRLEDLLRSGPVVLYPDPPAERDRYRRWLVHLSVNGEDVGCILIREGYARPWRGRRENWCVKTDFCKAEPEIDCAATGAIGAR